MPAIGFMKLRLWILFTKRHILLILLLLITAAILLTNLKYPNKNTQTKSSNIIPLEPSLARLASKATKLSKLPIDDFNTLKFSISTYKSVFDSLYHLDGKPRIVSKNNSEILHSSLYSLERHFHFLKTPVSDILQSYSGKGIVMTTGNWHFKMARHSINVIRRLNCTLPIHIYYFGENDLQSSSLNILKTMQNVTAIDLKLLLNDKIQLSGWPIKPLAMLVDSFQEFIFMDADALFFQNPAEIFNWDLYKKYGTVYFRDRTIKGWPNSEISKFIKDFIIHPSDYALKESRIFNHKSLHEGESGVIAMDKHQGGIHVLLMSCLMNMNPLKDIMYKVIHGDKESYWMSSETLGIPYAWAPGGGGTVGYLNPSKPDSICGGLYHPDENWKPFWFNGGIEKNKYHPDGRVPLKLEFWATDRTFENLDWDWETITSPFCLKPSNKKLEISELSIKEKEIGNMIVHEWLAIS